MKTKTKIDLFFNYIGLAVTASSGVLLNIAIVRLFDIAKLGYFNLIYALFVVLSQFFVFGVHIYCLKECSSKEVEKDYIITNGVISVLMVSIFLSLLIWLFSLLKIDISILSSIYTNIVPFCLSLTLFAVNKVILYSINGLSMMRAFAIFNSLRAIFMVAVLFFISSFENNLDFVYIFLFSELILCSLLLVYVSLEVFESNCMKTISCYRIKENLSFGKKCVWSGFSIELNSRVDVLVLSVYLSNSMVGFYSFTSMLVEGVYQLFVVVKNNINPKLSKLIYEKNICQLRSFIFKVFFSVLTLISLSSLALYLLYPFVVEIFSLDVELLSVLPILGILLAFLSLSSGFLVHDQIINLMGFPLISSRLFIAATFTNLILNFMLIPVLGLVGAAISTGISWLFFSGLLFFTTKKILLKCYI